MGGGLGRMSPASVANWPPVIMKTWHLVHSDPNDKRFTSDLNQLLSDGVVAEFEDSISRIASVIQ